MSYAVLLETAKKPIHVSAVADFFAKNPDVDPESVALEIEHLRECLVMAFPDQSPAKDLQKSYKILTDLMIMFREM